MDVPTTEFEDMDIDEVHLVKNGANGFPALVMKAAEDAVDQVIKADDSSKDCPTCKGTGKIMDGNRKCPDCDGTGNAPEDAEKAQMSAADQNDLPDSDFAYVEPGGKVEDGKTAPRSLRHFPIMDAAHVRNALARASQSPFGPKAMPAILAAAKKFDIDVSDDTAKAAGDETIPGDDGIPGSASWETADAARLNEATQSLLDLQSLLQTAAAREQVEGTTVDPDDLQQAWTLQDACYMLQNLLGVVAAMAVIEQREADNAPDDEALAQGAATKSGKRLSAKTIAALAEARDHLTATLGDDDPSNTSAADDDTDDDTKKGTLMTDDDVIRLLDEHDARRASKGAKPTDSADTTNDEIEKQTANAVEAVTVLKEAFQTVGETVQSALKSVDETLEKMKADAVADKADLQAQVDAVEAAAKEADEAIKADVEAKGADIELIKSNTPESGGPVKTRPVAALNKSAERDAVEIEIAELQRRADDERADQDARKGYLDRAKALRLKVSDPVA